ncbi:MAG: hypothetical protein EKK64_01790 [Neisseriaceae bacterium]|nr:MAG: hypothetical protein EKK64_01790 [Neisseriaceae bacterium]
MFDFLKNKTINRSRYRTDSESVILSCFFNPQNSPYRIVAFQKFYNSIKHLNYRIVECIIGNGISQLPDDPNIIKIYSDSVLWHKEALLNKLVRELPEKFKYVFWLDADVKFTNLNWMVDSANVLRNQDCNILQPFEYCVHLEKDKKEPDFDLEKVRNKNPSLLAKENKVWKSFCSNAKRFSLTKKENEFYHNTNYDNHGHVGFAWGAKREILETVPLYDKALIGGADHIIAHAAAGHIPHECITKSFKDDIQEVEKWMREFFSVCQAKIGYVKGDLYHTWHGDISKREYLKRIQDFTKDSKSIEEKDSNGLYVAKDVEYIKKYFENRETSVEDIEDMFFMYDTLDFFHDMGYYFSDYLREEFIYDTPQVENEDHIIGVEPPAAESPVEYDNHIIGVGSSESDSYPDNEFEPNSIRDSSTFESNDNLDHITGVGSSESELYPDNEPDYTDNGNFS